MNIETILLIISVLFCLAFALQIAIGIWKIIWKMAPVVVPLLIIACLLAATNNLSIEVDKHDTNAKYTESIKNSSRRN